MCKGGYAVMPSPCSVERGEGFAGHIAVVD